MLLTRFAGERSSHRSQAIDRPASGLYGATNLKGSNNVIALHSRRAVANQRHVDSGLHGSVPALIEKHGGRYIVSTPEYERVEGEVRETDPAMIVILEWPSKEAETAFMTDPDYAPYHKARLEGATNNSFSMPGVG